MTSHIECETLALGIEWQMSNVKSLEKDYSNRLKFDRNLRSRAAEMSAKLFQSETIIITSRRHEIWR